MYSKYFFILIFDIYVCLAVKPTFLGEGLDSNREIILNEHDELEILCMGYDDLILLYPKNLNTTISSSPVEIEELEDGPDKAKILRRNDTVYGDTGWYGCVQTNDQNYVLKELNNIYMTPYNYNESDVEWIYVYVKRDKYFTLSKNEDSNPNIIYYWRKYHNTVVFPCLPTSPTFTVTLYKNNTKVELNDRITYEPKKGFTMKKLTVFDSGLYSCSTNESSLLFNLHVEPKTGSSQKTNGTSYSLHHGNQVKLMCSLVINKNEDIKYQFYFKLPREFQSDRMFIDTLVLNNTFAENFIKVGTSLTVKNATREDLGVYECRCYQDSDVVTRFTNLTLDENGHFVDFPFQ